MREKITSDGGSLLFVDDAVVHDDPDPMTFDCSMTMSAPSALNEQQEALAERFRTSGDGPRTERVWPLTAGIQSLFLRRSNSLCELSFGTQVMSFGHTFVAKATALAKAVESHRNHLL
jgi:hypothetical protein